MRPVEITGRFKRDYKREKRSDATLDTVLQPVLDMLVMDEVLPANLSDHPLSGDWKGYRDCHVKPDLVLIYRKTEEALVLARIGSHSELFG
ncbi:type II toxin-antitoxin system YafQ family toxin [Sphingobium yanoikuyae]|jgi:mRNA interferase YafQ|uniref:Type II toxin-antitoxin system YafQ family toxin n=1 Tax=Sphingobium yanoikuyae TaxID=13690 RepID=A0A430BKS0_SPHYA|nr:type II toxin-antitoxin system YafQ family toxin [Sphingobium yanoikuyae]RSU52244.1 type II toxin-antitoxin system YafQ family toxin [Sphingobium yanoikuyae]